MWIIIVCQIKENLDILKDVENDLGILYFISPSRTTKIEVLTSETVKILLVLILVLVEVELVVALELLVVIVLVVVVVVVVVTVEVITVVLAVAVGFVDIVALYYLVLSPS